MLKPATHLAILYPNRGESDRQRSDRKRFSPPIDLDTPGSFSADRGDVAVLKISCDKIAKPDGLALLAIRSNDHKKSRQRAHLVNAGEFNRRYLTCQISAILYADRGVLRKSQLLHQAQLAIFADRRDRRIKLPSVSLALASLCINKTPPKELSQRIAPVRFVPFFTDKSVQRSLIS